VKWTGIVGIAVVIFVVVSVGVYVYFNMNGDSSGISLGSNFRKIAISEGGSYEFLLKIENNKDYRRYFDIHVEGLEDFVELERNQIELGAEEEKQVRISISNFNSRVKGVYVGSLNILSEGSSQRLPVILEVESDDVLFDSNVVVYPSRAIAPGETANADVKIFDLANIGTSSVEVTYFIKDFTNNEIYSEMENKVVDGSKVEFTKSVLIPGGVSDGDYVFGCAVSYKGYVGTSSTNLRVGQAEADTFFEENLLYFIAFLAFIALIFLSFVFYSIYSRDRLVSELKCQYQRELKRQSGELDEKEKRNESQLKTVEEKRVNRKLFRKVKKEKKKALDRILGQRKETLRKLKKANKKDEMKRQINKWKKSGYNVNVLIKTKVPSVDDVKAQIRKWKKKGYDTSVLEK